MLEIFAKLFSFGKDKKPEQTGVVNQPEVKKDDEVLFKDKSNFGSKIDRCKELADPEKYFSLFDKHIPKLADDGAGKKIALIDLSNLSVDEKIIRKNIKAEYWLFDNDLDGELLKALVPEAEIHVCDGEINVEMYNMVSKDMKFDVVVGNPPYDKGLHIKILKETMDHLNENGEVIWLSPISKWQYSELMEIDPPVKDVNVATRFSMDDAAKTFDIHLRCELGILTNKPSSIDIVDNHHTLKKIKDKISFLTKDLLKDHFEKDFKEYPVNFGYGCTIAGHGGHGKACYRIVNIDESRATRHEVIGHSRYYNAENKDKQHLIWKFYSNQMIRFICKEFGFGGIPYEIIPWITQFKDINGKTPFDYEWSFDDLCRFFNMDKNDIIVIKDSLNDFLYDDEEKLIEDTIKD